MHILFVTATRIGDAVLSTGLLDHLIQTRPEARFTIVCGAPAAPLFQALPRLDDVIVLRKRSWSRHWVDFWQACRNRRWDLIVNLRNTPVVWLLAARERRSYRATAAPVHKVAQLGRVLGLDPPPAPRLWLSDAAIAAAASLVPPGAPVLAVGATANWAAKEWPAERFADLVARLTGPAGPLPTARVALFGAARERPRMAPLAATIPAARLIDLCGGTTIDVAAACLARAAFYVGNDSGLMHLAAAAGVPTLGLFGPSRDDHYAPWGRCAAAVRAPEPYEALLRRGARQSLMTGLTVETAETASRALWARCGAPPATP